MTDGFQKVRAQTFWKIIASDASDVLERLIRRLSDLDASYCVIGGQAVNAYVDPLVSLDLGHPCSVSRTTK